MRQAVNVISMMPRFQQGGTSGPGRPRKQRLTNAQRAFVRAHAAELKFSVIAVATRLRQEHGYRGTTEAVRSAVHYVQRELQRSTLRAEVVIAALRPPPPWQVAMPLNRLRTLLEQESNAAMRMYRQHISTHV